MSPLTRPEFYLEPRHAMQIIGMDILLEGRGRAKSALILFKRLRVREMGGTSNGPKIRNKISATFRHLNLPCQNAEKVVTPRREQLNNNLSSKTFDIFLHCDILLNGSVDLIRVLLSFQCTKALSDLTAQLGPNVNGAACVFGLSRKAYQRHFRG